MPKRPKVFAPKFGEWLELCRGDRSLEQIAQKIRVHVEAVGLKVNRSLVQKIEQGRVPSWPLLAAFSRVYDVPIMETLSRLAEAMEFPGARDLLRHGSTKPSALLSGEGESHGSAQTRIRELEARIEQLETYEAIVRQMRPLLTDALVLLSGEGGTTTVQKTARRRSH